MEIERKWLLRRVPKWEPLDKSIKEQFYVSFTPEVRFRKEYGLFQKDLFYVTIKGEGSLSREEVERKIDKEYYETVERLCGGEAIKKYNYLYRIDGIFIEVNEIDENNIEPFVYAEVEFHSEEEAMEYEFPWPELVIKEVTNDPNYKMKNVYKRINNIE